MPNDFPDSDRLILTFEYTGKNGTRRTVGVTLKGRSGHLSDERDRFLFEFHDKHGYNQEVFLLGTHYASLFRTQASEGGI